MVRQSFDSISLTINEKVLGPQIPKPELKKAMPFIQSLKKRLLAGEPSETVFDRKLPYDEISVLLHIRAGLKKTTGCIEVDIVAVEDGGKDGTRVHGEGEGEVERESKLEGLPPAAEMAVPGTPSFYFENVRG